MNIKKKIILGIIINLISIGAIYVTMNKYAKEISANCIDCSYIQDVLINSISILLFPIIYVSSKFINNKDIFVLIVSLYAIINVFVGQIGTFNSRIGSWSSYSHSDIIIGVFLEQYFNLIMILVVFILTIKLWIYKQNLQIK